MNLFIDTNVLLSFYHLSSDDLEELRKLIVLLGENRVALHLPEQVVNEFRRNRENKIADALKRFNEERLSGQFPQICKEYEEYSRLRKIIDAFQQTKGQLLEKITKDFRNETFKADNIISELFSRAKSISISTEVVQRAKLRYDLGNPPGKDKSYGDAVNWECLLAAVPNGEDLFFITNDGDYISETNKEDFSYFLSREWTDKKGSKIIFFRRLSEFFKDKFPHIKLATELEKEVLINGLANSGSFASTRRILRKLSKISDLTDAQLNEVVLATIINSQVSWILHDEDINGYVRQLIQGHESNIDPDNLRKLNELLDPPEPDPDALHDDPDF
jgi:predicted nucleic acid-binding protein